MPVPHGAGHDFARVAVGRGKPLPEEVRARMERTLNADFSTVRIHEGQEAASVGARAYARGEHLHFRPGAFRPESGEGRRVLAHELTHVVQQRRGMVRSTGQIGGLPLNDDPRLEREADAAGARAAWNSAPLPSAGMVPAPRSVEAPGQAPPAQGVFDWARRSWNWLWGNNNAPGGAAPGGVVPAVGGPAPAAAPVVAAPAAAPVVARPRNPFALPKDRYEGGKPNKPDSLKGVDEKGKPLSFHHKYPSNKIVADTNLAVSGDPQAAANVAEWAQRGTKDPVSSIGQIAWTRHNVFPGPAPETREDDPGGAEADPHFTASGTVTPRSKVALEVEAEGGLGKIDPEVLKSRLAALESLQASAYDPAEWEPGDDPSKVRQKGKPRNWKTLTAQERLEYARAH